jgi:hypothetical protein
MDSAHQKTPEAQKAAQVVVCKWTRGELVRLLQMYNDKCLEYLGNVQAQTELTVIFNQTFVAGSESKPRCNHCNKFIADHEGRSEESPARRTDSTNDIGCPGLWSVFGLAGCVAQLRMEDEFIVLCGVGAVVEREVNNFFTGQQRFNDNAVWAGVMLLAAAGTQFCSVRAKSSIIFAVAAIVAWSYWKAY